MVKSMLKTGALLLALTFLLGSLWGCGEYQDLSVPYNITGVVLDSAGIPIPGIIVSNPHDDLGIAETDWNGEFYWFGRNDRGFGKGIELHVVDIDANKNGGYFGSYHLVFPVNESTYIDCSEEGLHEDELEQDCEPYYELYYEIVLERQ